VSDPAAYLTKALDRREAAAKAATPGPWRHNPDKHWRKPGTSWWEEAVFAGPAGPDATCVAGTGETDDPQSMADAHHIAAHDPAWTLRDVATKRWALAEYERMASANYTGAETASADIIEPLIRALAETEGWTDG